MRKPNKNKMAGVNSRFASVSESIFNGFLLSQAARTSYDETSGPSKLPEITECVYTKTIILLNLCE